MATTGTTTTMGGAEEEVSPTANFAAACVSPSFPLPATAAILNRVLFVLLSPTSGQRSKHSGSLFF